MRRPKENTLRLADGRALAYATWPGRGAPLVLLHGLYDCKEGWEVFAAASSRPVICFDLPGFGASDCPTSPTLRAYAEDLREATRQLGVQDYHLAGHSLGGAVASELAELTPQRVRTLTLIAPAGFCRQALAELTSSRALRRVVDAAGPLWLGNPVTATVSYMAYVSNLHPPNPTALRRFMHSARSCAAGARLATDAIAAAGQSPAGSYRRRGRYRGPVNDLWGERDRLVPRAHIEGVLRAYPQAQVTIWPGMGHHPQAERPRQLAGYLEDVCHQPRRRSELITRAA